MTPRRAAAILLVAASLASPARAEDPVDVVAYDIAVRVAPDELTVVVAIDFLGGGDLELELAPAMQIEKADVDGATLRSTRDGGRLQVSVGEQKGTTPRRLRFQLAGRPRVRFSQSSGGFLRTTIDPDIAYVRSQFAWYPRVANDPARHCIRVDARKDWTVHTCGSLRGRKAGGKRTTWTFETEGDVLRAGLVAGPYRTVKRRSKSGLTARALLLSGDDDAAQHVLGVATSALDHYRTRFGRIALADYTIVEMPEAFGGASGYGEAGYALLGAGAFRDGGNVPFVEALVAHEVAHLWFGQEVAFSDWISESLASWATLGYVEAAKGPDAAFRMRRKAIADFVATAASGHGVAASEMHGFGGGMDPRLYRVHAYDEGAAMLWMIGDGVGHDVLDKRMRGFLDEGRGRTRDSRAVFDDLRAMDDVAAQLVDLWVGADVLDLDVEHAFAEGKVTGTIRQRGAKPIPIDVDLFALCGDADAGTRVRCEGPVTEFSFEAPIAPDYFLVDPDYRVVAARDPVAGGDGAWVTKLIKVVNSVGARDEALLERTLQELRLLLRLRVPKYEPVVYTGIGRCLFRLGRHDEAAPALETALELGAGGPFHRRWCHLRLGCIADLAGRREEAKAHYEKAAGGDDYQSKLARRFLERRYRGIDKDG